MNSITLQELKDEEARIVRQIEWISTLHEELELIRKLIKIRESQGVIQGSALNYISISNMSVRKAVYAIHQEKREVWLTSKQWEYLKEKMLATHCIKTGLIDLKSPMEI